MGEGDAAVRWNQRATPVAAQAQQPVSGADGLGGREAYESGRRVGLGFAHSVVSEIQRKHFYGSGIDGLNELIRAASDDIARELYAPTSATTDIQPQLSGNSGQFDHFADARKMASSDQLHDADKVDAALADMVRSMFRSSNSVPVTRITIDRKQYDAAIDAARKEQA